METSMPIYGCIILYSCHSSIWVQVITREQQLMSLVLISKDAFIKEGENKPVPAPVLLWKETSPSWINVRTQ